MSRTEVLLLGGRSGVGKTTSALAAHELLKQSDVHHAVIEGDYMDLAYPAPHREFPSAGFAWRNLKAVWANYHAFGYRRLIYANTASVLFADRIAEAIGGHPRIIPVLLCCGDSDAARRLSSRNHGATRPEDLERNREAARGLNDGAGTGVFRLDTDALSPTQVAEELVRHTGWV
ncbi:MULTISPECIES: ATPase [Arthrobacter]|uniref:ATPase n=1 Tax=Arthrobacter terricola TaxID=2547396 RepID=A0A4R5KB95_9MICC|nr:MULTISPECIES: ATPase [Arthrobacter]MBT8163016.1 ATPase [Arthrobacter sp. GN70]TDF91778.1 ATPase [Arthrobacter terricola]